MTRGVRRTAALATALVMVVAAFVISSGSPASAATCWTERADIKGGSDPGAATAAASLTAPLQTTVQALGMLPKPPAPPATGIRVKPTETTAYSTSVTLVSYKTEPAPENDVQLILKDGSGATMIAEIPDPSCMASTSPLKPAVTAAWNGFWATYHPTGSPQTVNSPVRVSGIALFEYELGPVGHSPNGIEMFPLTSITPEPLAAFDRQWGSDRYATSAAIAANAFPGTVSDVYVATGANFPDALAGGAAAGYRHSPLLLVAPSTIPAVIATELTRLKPQWIHVLGGARAVSDTVMAALAKYASAGVDRIWGQDRFATAAAISARTYTSTPVPDVFISTGLNFPDALSGSAAAGHLGVPVLLVTTTSIPANTRDELTRLRPGRITILGGTLAVSSSVATALAGYVSSPSQVRRLWGTDRSATSASISRAVFPNGASTAMLATGAQFADALSGGPAAAQVPGPVLLSSANCVPTSIAQELARLDVGRVTLLGGTLALSSKVQMLYPCAVYVPPPTLICQASVSNVKPRQNSTVVVYVRTGLPAAAVTAVALFQSSTRTVSGVSDSTALARLAFALGTPSVGYTVRVTVTVSKAGQTVTCATAFTPVA